MLKSFLVGTFCKRPVPAVRGLLGFLVGLTPVPKVSIVPIFLQYSHNFNFTFNCCSKYRIRQENSLPEEEFSRYISRESDPRDGWV